MFSFIPEDSIVPPVKPADMGETNGAHHMHPEHAMNPSAGNLKTKFSFAVFFCTINRTDLSNDDQSYEDYVDEVEHMRSRNRETDHFDINKILSQLGLPEYEYIDAENYDYLLPKHLTYGKEQIVKLHNAKIMTREI